MMVWCNPGGTYLMDYLLLYIIFFFEEDVDIKYIKIIYIYIYKVFDISSHFKAMG